jgi:predicted hotdog family 3-hydroxylacyl-ACP dehydratase
MPAAIETLIPHRAPMLFIDALIDCTDTTATATAQFGADHFAAAGGALIETALVECVAQTVAAALRQRAKSRGQSGVPPIGMLIAITNFQIRSSPAINKPLRIQIRDLKRLGPMLMISGSISCEGQPIASGELTLYA